MSSSGTLRRATPDEVFAGLLVEREIVDAELVSDVRAALVDEAGGGNLIEALIDSEILPLETAELLVAELGRGVLTCPGCPGRFNVAKLARGSRFKCKTCGNPVTVPAMAVTREVLGRFGWAKGGDVNLSAAASAPVIEERKTVVTSDEDAIDQAMALGTGEGQLLDFTDVDVTQETIDGTDPLGTPSKPKLRAGRSAPKRASHRAAKTSDRDEEFDDDDDRDYDTDTDTDEDDDDYFDTVGESDLKKPKPAMMMWVVWVVIPVAACALVMYYTAELKTWMFGGPDIDTGDYHDSGGSRSAGSRKYKPSIPPDQCDDWVKATTAVDAARAALTAARAAAGAGDTGTAHGKYNEADEQFQAAYEAWDDVTMLFGKGADHLQPTVDGWVKEHEAAADEAAKLK